MGGPAAFRRQLPAPQVPGNNGATASTAVNAPSTTSSHVSSAAIQPDDRFRFIDTNTFAARAMTSRLARVAAFSSRCTYGRRSVRRHAAVTTLVLVTAAATFSPTWKLSPARRWSLRTAIRRLGRLPRSRLLPDGETRGYKAGRGIATRCSSPSARAAGCHPVNAARLSRSRLEAS